MSSSSDDEDYRRMHTRGRKKKAVLPPPDIDMDKFTTQVASQLMKERGFEITSEEFGFKQKAKVQKQTNYVPALDRATFPELQKELQKADNVVQVCSVLKCILQHPDCASQHTYYAVIRCEFLYKNRQFQDCKMLCNQLLEGNLDNNSRVRVLVALGRAQMDCGEIYNALMQGMRANSYCKMGLVDTISQSNYDQSVEQIKKECENMLQSALIKTSREFKRNVQLIGVQGNSGTGCLGLGDTSQSSDLTMLNNLKNRQVLSIACGEHHVLALVSGCSCISPFSLNECTKHKCNGGYEVFGWGENFLGQAVMDQDAGNFISEPRILSKLSGKQIIGVAAYKCTSLAWSVDGTVYQWGVEHQPITMVKITQIVIGNQFIALLNEQKQVYIQGNILNQSTNSPILKYSTLTNLNVGQPIQQIAAGDSHLLMLSDDGNIYALGSNLMCQMGMPKDSQFIKQPTQLQIDECFSVSASANASMFVTSEGEVLYCGQITPNRIIDYPKSCQIPDDYQMIQAGCYDGVLYALNLKGKLYKWDPENEPKFKPFLSGQIRSFTLCRGMRILQSTTLKGEWCRVELQEDQELFTYEDITITINLGDQYGPYGIKPLHPMRYNLLLANQPMDIKQLTNQSIELSKLKIIQQNENKIYLNTFNEQNLIKSQILEDDDPIKHTLTIQIDQQGTYLIYLFLNDEILIDCPLEIQVAVGDKAEQLEMQQKHDEFIKQKKLIDQAKQLEQQQKLEESKRLKQLEIEQEKQQKLIDTKKRADEALQAHKLKQAEEQAQKEEERKLRKDALTGGGFDLSKVKQPTQTAQAPRLQQQQQKQQQQSTKQQVQQQLPKQPQQPLKDIPKSKDFTIKSQAKPTSQPPQRVLNPVIANPKLMQSVQQQKVKDSTMSVRMTNSSQMDRQFTNSGGFQFRTTDTMPKPKIMEPTGKPLKFLDKKHQG